MIINVIVNGQDMNKLITGELVRPISAAAMTGNLNVSYQMVSLDTLEYDFLFGDSGSLLSVQRKPKKDIYVSMSLAELQANFMALQRFSKFLKEHNIDTGRLKVVEKLIYDFEDLIEEAKEYERKQD